MSRDVCKIILVGRLGKDPEMKYTQQGTPVTSFNVAVNKVGKSQDGQAKEETEWFRVSAWRKLAEISNEYLRKGSRVYIEGRFSSREWQTPEGQTRTSLEIDASDVIMLDTKAQSEAMGRSGGYDDEPRGGGNTRPSGGKSSGGGGYVDDGDQDPDDIPF